MCLWVLVTAEVCRWLLLLLSPLLSARSWPPSWQRSHRTALGRLPSRHGSAD